MPVRFLISTLKPGVDPAEYERWVRERDYPWVRGRPTYRAYTVHRIRGPISGAAEACWQYLERIDVASLEQHARDLASPEGEALRAELYGRFLDRSQNITFVADAIE
jgi:REDY-like protein HapK